MGSLEHSLSSLTLNGALRADGESFGKDIREDKGRVISGIGPGGGSGGTILLFVHMLVLGESSIISTNGGHGSPGGGGGGGGGRIHFHWPDVPVGDEYIPLANVKGSIITRFIYIAKDFSFQHLLHVLCHHCLMNYKVTICSLLGVVDSPSIYINITGNYIFKVDDVYLFLLLDMLGDNILSFDQEAVS